MRQKKTADVHHSIRVYSYAYKLMAYAYRSLGGLAEIED
jgi:hypothetical protein